jgi:hypothetical protein
MANKKNFDQYIRGDVDKKDIDRSLSEIYQDEGGKRVNVREVDIKPKRNLFTRIALVTLYVLIAAGIAAGAYYWVISRDADSSTVDLKISAPEELIANEPFEYTVEYKNQENASLADMQLTLVYPDNFIFESSTPSPSENNNSWRLPELRQFGSGQVIVRGRLIAPVGSSNLLFADLNYRPSNITSEFKKSSSLETVLISSGFDSSIVAPTSVLVGQDAELVVKYKPQEKNFIEGFNIRFAELENLEFPKNDYGEGVAMLEPGVFTIDKIGEAERELRLKFKFKDKKNDKEDLRVYFEYRPDEASKNYAFEEQVFSVEVVKNSLNLTLIANGEASDQGIDFGQTLNYSISYVNKGAQAMDDVVIMAVLEGEALDWRKLSDNNNGTVTGRTIVWTKTEVPALASISKDQEGSIDFSIPVRTVNEASLIRDFEIKGYAQFAVGGKAEELSKENEANRSNQLTVKINSDVMLDEAVRYFDEDNIAVGTGPLPPQVGQTSTFKVYWKISNSLHELGALKVTTVLPNYVNWDGKEQADAGTLTFDEQSNQVTWQIGRLPLSATNVEAEFSISVRPKPTDINKLLILVSGTTLSGTDNQTTYNVSQTLKAQTTKLEKDDIADTNGIIK